MVECFLDTEEAGGSIPPAPTRAHSKVALRIHGMDEIGVRFPVGPRAVSSVVEHFICNEGVTGSNPVRSTGLPPAATIATLTRNRF